MLFEFYKVLTGTIIIGVGFFLGYSIIGIYTYSEQKLIAAELTEDEELEKAIQEYVNKYLEEYTCLDRELMDEEKIKSLGNIIEDTPLGMVKMYYSHVDESFIYWSGSQVPYKVLESVSRKYVIDNDVKCIHYDMEEEIETKRQEILEATQEEPEDPVESVFVTFKKAKPSIKKKQILCNNANRYSYRGKYSEGQACGTETGTEVTLDTNSALCFQDYLKIKDQCETDFQENEIIDEIPGTFECELPSPRLNECHSTPSTDDISRPASPTPDNSDGWLW